MLLKDGVQKCTEYLRRTDKISSLGDITRWREDMNFIFSYENLFFTNEHSEWVKYSK